MLNLLIELIHVKFITIYIIETKQAKKFFDINYNKKKFYIKVSWLTKACRAKHPFQEPEGSHPPKHAVDN